MFLDVGVWILRRRRRAFEFLAIYSFGRRETLIPVDHLGENERAGGRDGEKERDREKEKEKKEYEETIWKKKKN